jgi:flavin-dependent dehydrogenase
LFADRRFYIALQARVKKQWDAKAFDVWFGSKAPEFFAWSVPESSSISRVGLAMRKGAKPYFDALLKEVGGKVVDYQAGPLPIYNGKPCSKGNVFLVGDAGTLSKATTGGGIITGMLSGKALASALAKGTSYERELKPLRRELKIHYWLRRALNTFSDQEYERLVRRMSTPRVRRILAEHPREFPSRFVLKLVLAQPGFVFHSKKFIKTLTTKL